MNDGNKAFTSTRMKLAAIFAAIAVFFAFINWLPIEKPFFLAKDSETRAFRLLMRGQCEEGYAIYEKRAAGGKDWIYLSLGRWLYTGMCGTPDIPRAIQYYRQAAAKGWCQANFQLAGITLLHPVVSDVNQITPENNLFTTVMCAYYVSDDILIAQYFDNDHIIVGFEVLEQPFRDALERRKKFRELPTVDQRMVVSAIINGIGYDANPHAKP